MSRVDVCECGGDTRVDETRPAPDGAVRRRRVCLSCSAAWATYEVRGIRVGAVHRVPAVEQQLSPLEAAVIKAIREHITPEYGGGT